MEKLFAQNKTENNKILIDMDDVLVNLHEAWIYALNKSYGLNVSTEDITDWDMTSYFSTLTMEQIFSPLSDGDFWYSVKPKDGAVKYVKRLKDDGYQVYVCTTSYYKTLKEKMDGALFRYFDYLTWADVIVTSNKQMIDADFLIDDGKHNLVSGKYKGILMDMPHNRKFDEKKYGIVRVHNWEEIYKYIEGVSG